MSNQHDTGPVWKNCLSCKTLFRVAPHRVANGEGKYCSRLCKCKGTSKPKRTQAERFWDKVEKSEGCWLWVGAKTPGGYGKLGRGAAGAGTIAAHRLSFEIHHGQIPHGLCVLHSCDNPACVCPDHLFLGTLSDNTQDMLAKGRMIYQVNPGKHFVGEGYKHSKLTEEKVREIRRLYSLGGFTQAKLAAMFSVSRSNIVAVLSRRAWKHVL